MFYELVVGTWGARPGLDGNDGVSNPCSVAANIPIEVAEADFPVLIERYGFVTDSAGAGHNRGGLAIERSWRMLAADTNLLVRSDRQRHRPYGLAGGHDGTPSENLIVDGESSSLHPPMFSTGIDQGALFHHRMAGGGGWGDPLTRDPQAVADDVRNDKVSRLAALETYAVVLSDSGAVDVPATVTARAARRTAIARSLRRGGSGRDRTRRDRLRLPGPTRIAIDIGGTFTDVVLARPDGSVSTRKVPSTPEDYADGIVQGATELLAASGVSPGALDDIVHATTVAANTILEGKGARTALVTTEGFRDVLEMRRLRIPTLYDLRYEKPPPLVPRRRRYEVRGRLGPDGQIWEELDEAAVRALAGRLRNDDVEAVAISLINAYADPRHELRVAEILREELGGGVYVSRSSDVLPEIREYERTSTTVVNAYIAPTVRRYLSSLVERLRSRDIDAPIRVMQSSGGTTTLTAAVRRPAHIIESGPAAGVIGCARLARLTGTANMISLDMGGTTAKTAMIEDGEPVITGEYEVGGGINVSSRLVKGGGYAVKLPYIDVSEIGAGGGSIIRVDEFGRIHVGPDSAGASPGPACYGRGGADATLTDALVVLGYLNPAQLAGGELPIDASLAEQALDTALAAPLGITRTDAAYGALTLSVATMTRAVKAVSTYRGRDPREFTLCAFGGNGPVVGAAIAQELDIATWSSRRRRACSAPLGLVHSGSEYQFAKSVPRSARAPSRSELHALYDELEGRCARWSPMTAATATRWSSPDWPTCATPVRPSS